MDDPLSNIFNISSDVDNQAKIMIDRLVKSFLKHHSQIIKFAYRTKTYFNDLHYSIVLIEDNILNRSQILEFYEKYDLLEISHKFPVFLQFVPVELISKIPTSEEIVTPAN